MVTWTLDPLASGVLLIALGKATRLFDEILQKTKQYVAVFSFGYETNTLDIEGEVTNSSNYIPSQNEIENAILKLTGKQMQIPPNFSAKKVNGKKAYELARENVEFELKPKEIEVFEFKLLEKINDTDYKFLITCSSGTYIRSLGRDLGRLCNSFATMTSLIRTTTGKFKIENSIKLDDILNKNSLEYDIIKIEDVLPYEIIELDNNKFNSLKNGITLKFNANNGKYLLKYNEFLLGIGQVNNNLLKLTTYLLEN